MAETIRKIDIDEIEKYLSNLEFTPSPIDFEKIRKNYIKEIGNGSVILKLKASKDIGLGHLSRMITLGWILSKAGAEVIFAINDFEYAKDRLKSEFFKFEVNKFETDELFMDFLIEKYEPNTIVVDEKYRYSVDDIRRWKKSVKFISLDYLAEGYEICDRIIIPNAHFEPEKNQGFENIKWGWDWVLINKDVFKLKPKNRLSKKIEKIVITTGGSDPSGMCFKFLDWLNGCKREVLVLIGDAFKHRNRLNNLSLPDNFKILPYSPNKLLEGDIAIATFGVTVYELIYLNVPFVCMGHTEENQEGCKVLREKCKIINPIKTDG